MNLLFLSFRSIGRLLDRILNPFRLQSLKRDRRRNAGSAGKGISKSNGPARDFSKMTLPETMAELQKAADASREVFVETLRELASACDSRDPYTRGHSERVTRFSVEIARIMGLPEDEVEQVRIGALVHDIGKITIAEEILNKPSVLTEAEYEAMKMHTTQGYELLKHIPQLKDILPGMQFHHELLDGKGYPNGLKGDEIPRITRIITVADCFDAMTTIRPYQDPAPIDYVLGTIRSAAGVKYDDRVVEALVRGVRTGRIVTRIEDRAQVKESSVVSRQ
jgi:HD-GYP domain-containing protein (c-di-GMP phosphodiesterase class II)